MTFHYLLYFKRSPRSSFNLSFVILVMPELGYSNAFIDLENAIVILVMPGLGYVNAVIILAMPGLGYANAVIILAIAISPNPQSTTS
ncbi:hypothetical protein [Nostoc sp. ChiSLP03a]|uniref:hypothetical protein n=1 Tax=Nostoc sp. ChiSLP03a TaxID=3075380 RepID=UPI002AD36894|nr:hypothetical protein [Nostoc sp. ChiSLP03a]MDZ8215477.1 hypothetical protein [Nostoc sp. ChiSLP03a]